jgi:antirestriction protein ArdC
VLILWAKAQEAGYTSAYWMTYRQASELGGQVRKGEHSTQVVYYGSMVKDDPDAGRDEDGRRQIRFLRTFNVFNADQIDRLPAPFYAKPEQPGKVIDRIPELEAFAKATGADIREGGGRAFYRIDQDYIQMPDFRAFSDAEVYYATRAHELVHWTRHPSRLDRNMGRKSWGDEGYAAEELVAELGAAFLGAELGLRPGHIEDHASYIGSWLKVLRNDRRFIFIAAAKAQEAADYLLACREDAQAKSAGRVQ